MRTGTGDSSRWFTSGHPLGAGLVALALSSNGLGCSCSSQGHGRDPHKANAAFAPDGGLRNFDNFDNAGGDGGQPVYEAVDGSRPLPSCVSETQEAREVVVDMYLMLDRSSSMLEPSADGTPKWTAVSDAISAFVSDARSSGLGVGMQYFPLGKQGVPETCTADSDCGSIGGPCLIRACVPLDEDTPFMLCLDNLDCPLGSACRQHGVCSGDASYYCFNLGAGGCETLGDCNPVVSGCLSWASCDVADYTQPAVAIAPLPGNAVALMDSLGMTEPIGATPTSAAVVGAIERAKRQALSEPTHKVIAVVATDGNPTECLPIDPPTIANIIDAGLNTVPSIDTYLIGVFGDMDSAGRDNAGLWARAGGTERAFIIDPGQDVTMQFLDALERIRTGSIACEYELPAPPEGSELDFGFVNVAVVPAGADTPQDLAYVASAAGCSADQLGWHYDVDPTRGDTPMRIQICPETCTQLQANTGGRVEIQLGCATRGPD